MSIARALRQPATLCALLLGLCTLAANPFVEMGQNDDFAYVLSAKTLAETGHIAYYGWASAMLGWQLVLGAAFMKLFGTSFAAARSSILLVAMVTAFLLQRIFVRMGLSEENASFATLTVVLSPLYVPLSFSFMSDISGLFAMVLCFYLCLRALAAQDAARSTGWLIAAMLSNALLGTARQTAWLGVLLVVPATCWLLRRRPLRFIALGFTWLVSLGFALAAVRWFSRQMYATVESASGLGTDSEHIFNLMVAALRVPFGVAFYLVPILFAFAVSLRTQSKKLVYLSLFGALALSSFFLFRPHSFWIATTISPTLGIMGNYATSRGILELQAIGVRPVALGTPVRLAIFLATYFSAFGFAVLVWTRARHAPNGHAASPARALSWRQMLVLIAPFLVGYGGFVALRVLSGIMYDRYLLPVFMVGALLATRFYQDNINARLPRACYAVLVLFAAYSVAGTHDNFAMDRARLRAADEMEAAGVPRTAILAGFGYDGWTQIQQQGYVDVDNIRTSAGIRRLPERRFAYRPCGDVLAKFFPAIRPQYAVSYDDAACDPQGRFAPVAYHLWLPPFSGYVYIRAVDPALLAPLDESTQLQDH